MARNRDWKSEWTIWSVTARQNPRSVIARAALGSLYHQRGMRVEAVGEYRDVLRLVPNHLAALTNLCEALPRLGAVDEATRVCERAVELHPEDGKLHNNLGNCYKLKGRTEDAVRQYKLAARLDATLAEPLVNLGAHQAKSGDLEAATRSFERAVKIDPDLPEAHFNLAILRQIAGDRRGARRHMLAVLRLSPPDALRGQAQQALADLGPEPVNGSGDAP